MVFREYVCVDSLRKSFTKDQLLKNLTETYLKLKLNKTEMIFLVSFYNQKAKTKITSSFNLLKLR